MPGRRVLITGVGSFMGATLARRLEEDPAFEYVAGLDTRLPSIDLSRTEIIQADIRDPAITSLLASTRAIPWCTTRSCAGRARVCPGPRCTT